MEVIGYINLLADDSQRELVLSSYDVRSLSIIGSVKFKGDGSDDLVLYDCRVVGKDGKSYDNLTNAFPPVSSFQTSSPIVETGAVAGSGIETHKTLTAYASR